MAQSRKVFNNVTNLLWGIASFLIPIIGIVRICISKKGSVGAKIATSVVYMIFWLYTASLMFFIVWAFYNSVKTDDEFFDNMNALPTVWHFSNYADAYRFIEHNDVGFIGMFINSIWFAAGSSFLATLSHAVTGYIFAKYRFPGKEIAFSFILFTIALPIVGSLPSMYKVVYTLHLEESPLFLVTYLGGFGSNFLIMYAFFNGIDKTYMEAAEMDGATRFGIFFKIMLPLAVGPSLSLFLLTFITQWNNYETPILFLSMMPTLSSGLYEFSVIMRFPQEDIVSPQMTFYAGTLLASVPVIILVICFGEKLMTNVNIGGIKG
ncbi:MAG: carbohydrate ABC transporter permease [Clostridia bacterium]|nr:carbohydrate ABC transporter permease [Clostridia bacterium]